MKIDVLDRSPMLVACRHYKGPLGDPLGRFWRSTVTPWLAEHGLLDAPRYGVTLDDPMKTPVGEIRYDACVEAPPGILLPDADAGLIAGGRYAMTTFKGTADDIGAAWSAFIGDVLANHSPDTSRPPFERYPRGASYDAKSGTFACELHFPVLVRR